MSLPLKSLTRLAAGAAIALGIVLVSPTLGFAQAAGNGGHGSSGSGHGSNEVQRCDGGDCPKPLLKPGHCAQREPRYDRWGNLVFYNEDRRCRLLPGEDYAQ